MAISAKPKALSSSKNDIQEKELSRQSIAYLTMAWESQIEHGRKIGDENYAF